MRNFAISSTDRNNQSVGQLGERIAENFLREKGYSILKHHYTCQWGELDLIAKHDSTIVFIEVKTRVGIAKGNPYEAVTARKLRSLYRPIQFYILQNHLSAYKLSLDVISIILKPDLTIDSIKHFEHLPVGWR